MSSSKKPLDLWVEEDTVDILRTRYRVLRSLYSCQSEFQHVDVVETRGFGKMLLNDSVVMISERDERVYHEMIAHVAAFTHPGVERALVVGGGDGGTVRELLRHPSVGHVRLVEIDGAVVEACREHIPQTAAALDDPRVDVRIEDAIDYVRTTDERYDLVIVDSSDPVGPALPLFGPEFYGHVRRILTDEGLTVTQANSPFLEPEAQRSLAEILSEAFSRVHFYNYANMTYPCGLWSFSYAAKGDLCPIGDFDPRRVAQLALPLEFYNPAIHRASFALPEFQQRSLGPVLSAFKRAPVGES